MTTTRLPASPSTSDQHQQHLLSSLTLARPSPTHRSSIQPTSSTRQPTRARPSPTAPSQIAQMRPPMHAGPASHSGHSSSSLAAQGYAAHHHQHKSRSAHGHGGAADGQQQQQSVTYGGVGSSGATRVNGGSGSAMGGTRKAGGIDTSGKVYTGRGDDLPLGSPNPAFASSSSSRPSSPSRLSYSHSDETHSNSRYLNNAAQHPTSQSQSHGQSTHSLASSSSHSNSNSAAFNTSSTSVASTVVAPAPAPCSACHQPMSGQFVRALGTVFHLDCFRCRVSVAFFCLLGTVY